MWAKRHGPTSLTWFGQRKFLHPPPPPPSLVRSMRLHKAVRDASQTMLDEFVSADTVVMGLSINNFTLPSQLKGGLIRSWFSARPHNTAG
jgi:hypothetical protein